jgi:outer membrane protein assembly factor BamB
VLLAEHGANKVTERDLKGKVLWEKEVGDGPLVVQRLVNGNTFIATAAGLVEVDREGKEVFAYRRPLETIRKATKLRNGDIALVTSGQRYVRLSPDLKELRSFEADVRTNGGRIDVQPNGHILVPLKDSNKVVEYDSEGKMVWEAAVDEPVAAVRLPNGHTLITTLNQRRAFEVDGSAQEIWEFKSTDSRVTRAWRR